MREYLFVIVIAAVVTYAATPLLRWLAVRLRAFTPVRDRDVHSVPIPRLGGVSMFLGFSAATLVAAVLPFSKQMFAGSELRGVLLGATLVCLIGAIDDVRELDWFVKLAGQLAAAGVMAFYGVQLYSLPLGQTVVLPTPVLVSLTIFFVILATNAVNFVDGLDGLAAGIVAIAAVSFFGYAYLIARSYSPPNVFTSAAFISAALVGICLGFLPHNFHPARIFMGDSGALLLGLLLAAAMISITGTITGAEVSADPFAAVILPLLVPLAIMLIPLLDLLLAVVRRTRAGLRPWQADAGHLHHRMLMWGHGHRRAVLLLWFWAAAAAFPAVGFVFLPPGPAFAALIVMLLGAGVLTFWLPRATLAGRAPTPGGGVRPPPGSEESTRQYRL